MLTRELFYLDVFSCKDLKDSGYAVLDGEYYINPVKSCDYPIKVYCHDMHTSSPKDYITLPSGPVNNYAIVFDKRMHFENKYQCSGRTGSFVYSKSGTTRFNKVSWILKLSCMSFLKLFLLIYI